MGTASVGFSRFCARIVSLGLPSQAEEHLLRIALIDLDYPHAELNEPLGIEMLAATIERLAPRSVACNLTCLQIPQSDYRRVFSEFSPDVVALSTKIGSLARIEEIISFSRSQPSRVPPLVILGGTLATLEPDELARRFRGTICVVGEGEAAMAGIVRLCIENDFPRRQLDLSKCIDASIPNIVLSDNEHIQRTPRSTIFNLNALPFPTRVFIPDILKNGGLIRAEASRGCPWNKCTFCMVDWKYASQQWRPFDIDRIVREAGVLSGLGASLIYYTDEEFVGSDTRRIAELCRELVEAKTNGTLEKGTRFYASTSVRSLLGMNNGGRPSDPVPLLNAMKAAGFMGLFLGIESGSDSQLARFGKGASSRENLSVIRAVRRAGLECDIGFIMFDPATTIDELAENLSFLRAAGLWTHDSRFTKRLRVILCARVFETLNGKRCGASDYDEDQAEEEVPFTDWKVEAIYRAFEPWERKRLGRILQLQGEARAAHCESKRIRLKRAIGRLRCNDLALLAAYTKAISRVSNPKEAAKTLSDVRQAFTEGRKWSP